MTTAREEPRRLTRAGVGFFVDLVGILSAAFEQDLSLAITFLAVLRANRADRTAHWDADGAVGPSLRRREPISIHVLAQALDLPYETVRHHVRRLRDAGYCATGPEGVTTHSGLQNHGAAPLIIHSIHGLALALMRGPVRSHAPSPQPPPQRSGIEFQVARLTVGYFLDSLAVVRRTLGLKSLDVAVLQCAWILNR